MLDTVRSEIDSVPLGLERSCASELSREDVLVPARRQRPLPTPANDDGGDAQAGKTGMRRITMRALRRLTAGTHGDCGSDMLTCRRRLPP